MGFEDDKLIASFDRGAEAKDEEWQEKIGNRLRRAKRQLKKHLMDWSGKFRDETCLKCSPIRENIALLHSLLEVKKYEEEELEWQPKK